MKYIYVETYLQITYNTPWINKLKTNYSANVNQRDYEINIETLN